MSFRELPCKTFGIFCKKPELGCMFFVDSPDWERCSKLPFSYIRTEINEQTMRDVNQAKIMLDKIKQAGMKPIVHIQYKRDPKQTGKFIQDVIQKLPEIHGTIIEVYNEPNISPPAWGDHALTPEEYMSFVPLAAEWIKNSGSKFLGAATAQGSSDEIYDPVWWNQKAIELGLAEYIDFWNVHWYLYKEEHDNLARDIIKMMRKEKDDIPIIVTEFGDNDPNEDYNIKRFNDLIKKFSKNFIDVAIFFQWDHDREGYGLRNKLKLYEHIMNYSPG